VENEVRITVLASLIITFRSAAICPATSIRFLPGPYYNQLHTASILTAIL